ncbi:hypothetical protein CHLNCDRAFT_54556 [Chlorella variabilis]|uniref:RING-type domain-containing protein n=1 Tax=Chlorella variabilis TaxID=554065 RepID=E1ZPD3_CHLVA|nr:hypothetical protein CHLNCDRAFT_54556 [Chlorella variabilis]EFN52233.1 hypothetical protein CHLNCDRAFT_54556 [Chlorella variabilis]|eukprot:XP_005844335.1 hypothetical protein CHLNCDRAFT_54556 [Chlorella variabilis]
MADTAPMEVEEPQQQEEKKGKGKANGKRFEIKKWNAVAMWSWAICTDTCAICRNNLYEPSIEYQANPTGDADHPGLSIAWGTCGHVFHLDCIQRWLKTRSACPLCNRERPEHVCKERWSMGEVGDLDVSKLQGELHELNRQRVQDVRPGPGDGPWPPLEEQSRRPNLSSVVAAPVNDGPDRKRPAEGSLLEENVDVKRRNKRLFGAILGTLQRFSREEEQAKTTAAAQRRAELERKAEEKKAEEGRRLRQQARDEMRQMRYACW